MSKATFQSLEFRLVGSLWRLGRERGGRWMIDCGFGIQLSTEGWLGTEGSSAGPNRRNYDKRLNPFASL